MKPHALYAVAIPRGDAARTDHELGLKSAGVNTRRWRRESRPELGEQNTGRIAPLAKAKAQILAHDRVNPQTADILVFDLESDLRIQRAKRAGQAPESDPKKVALGVIESAFEFSKALLAEETPQEELEIKAAVLGGWATRARYCVETDPDHTPAGHGQVVELKAA